MYNSPKNIFQQKLKEVCNNKKKSEDMIAELIQLQMFKTGEKKESILRLSEVYSHLGLEVFTELIDILSGETIEFPTKESFKDTLLIAICYYYKIVENKNWQEIREILNEKDINTIKYGIHCNQLDEFIKRMVAIMNKRKEEENVN